MTLLVDRVNHENVLEQLQLVVLNMYYCYYYKFIFLLLTHCDDFIPEKTGQIIPERERKKTQPCLLYFQAKLL